MALHGRGNGQKVAGTSSRNGKEGKLNVDGNEYYGWSLMRKK